MSAAAQNAATPAAAEKTRALLADLWKRNRPVIEERLAILERTASADPLSEDLKTSARDIAHKLSGSLGMFGFDHGTVLARELEHLLDSPQPNPSRLAELTKQLREMLLPTP